MLHGIPAVLNFVLMASFHSGSDSAPLKNGPLKGGGIRAGRVSLSSLTSITDLGPFGELD